MSASPPAVAEVSREVAVGGEPSSSKRVLEPIERVSEVLFGLIMVLTFTCSFSVAESGRAQVRALLLGALGCNLAWGIIDAIMYVMGCLAEKARSLAVWRALACGLACHQGRSRPGEGATTGRTGFAVCGCLRSGPRRPRACSPASAGVA
jgi:hypothetical protein